MFVASIAVAAFAIALVPTVVEAKLPTFVKIIPGYTAPAYRPTGTVQTYRPASMAPGYRVTPKLRVVPGYTAPAYRPTGYVKTYRPAR